MCGWFPPDWTSHYPCKKTLKSRDIYMLWSGEIVVSIRVAGIIETAVDSTLQPIWNTMRGARSASPFGLSSFRQLVVRSKPLTGSDPTRFGDQPFRDTKEQCKCPLGLGEVRGQQLLSGLYLTRSSWDGSDVCMTDVFVGTRMGLFRPYRHVVISRRLFRELQKVGVRGVRFEVVGLT